MIAFSVSNLLCNRTRITMGVRVSDQEWKRTLNEMIRENQDELNEILLSFGVPLLDEHDKPIGSKKGRRVRMNCLSLLWRRWLGFPAPRRRLHLRAR
ncbi:hypothetical protein [Aureimonas glaciei]|uniref:Uncharacterized protein n=1 Tax=Aureimonas glaciei TaxID=1776957 RepID=A0A916YBG6_9HYPH|nr:hypothetical protein GCM10011335_45820 [Aureimonas glaciei]